MNIFVVNNLKAQLQAKESLISKLRAHIATLKGKNMSNNNELVNNASVIAPGMFRLDLEPISHRLKNNREAHEDYLQKTKEHTNTQYGIEEQARKLNLSDPYLEYACKFTIHVHELLVYISETCPSSQVERKKLVVVASMNKIIKVKEPKESSRLITSTSASRSQSKNNTRKNRITPAASSNKNTKAVKVHPRKVMSSSNKRNHVSMCNTNPKHAVKDTNSKFICSTCNGCLFYANHDTCVVAYINDMNVRVNSNSGKRKNLEWKPTSKVFTSVGHRWLPTGRTFTINGTKCPMTRITSNPIVPPKETSQTPIITHNLEVKVYHRRTKVANSVIKIVLWYLYLGCSKYIIGQRSQLINFVEKFLGIVIFGNDNIANIIWYGDYQIGNVTISTVYYVEGLGHNLFSVGQFYDYDLKVAFRKTHLLCLKVRSLKNKVLLWHRRLSQSNFATINELAKQGLVRDLPKIKYEKDHLCFACSLAKSKKHTHKPKSEDSIQEKLYLLHMDLCGPMRIESINGKKYILVSVDDYSRFTWVKFLRSKDETLEFVIKFLKMIQVHLNTSVRYIRTDNGTEFVNHTLKSYYEDVGISHQSSVAHTPQKNGVVERHD
ncbi:retrovirus-related pol polyprotein from transposon TNT 1-94 [Tanacetum coccineum]